MTGRLTPAPALLLLADGRLPIGGHAHSAGMEAAVLDDRVSDEATVEAFVLGRLHTAGLVDAAMAAATLVHLSRPAPRPALRASLADLDAEAEARIAPPPLRAASRRLGRQLVRVGVRCWPHAVLELVAEAAPAGLHQSVALGAVGVAAGLTPAEVAALAVHHAITTPAQAAVRLLGLDPFAVAALTSRLAERGAAVVEEAVAASTGPLADLPARSGPLVDIAAMDHARRDARLFAT